jgi:mono/diheme cytochrome c family protein
MFTNFRLLSAVLFAMAIAVPPTLAADSPDEKAQLKFFETKVRPLLAKHCFKCHGEKKDKGGLRMISRGSLLKGGESGASVVPGKPDESLLIEAVRYESLEMPPAGKLPDSDIRLLESWVKAGAFWPETDEAVRESHTQFSDEDRAWWSFQPVKKPAVPKSKSDWVRNEIDSFILRKLRKSRLTPAPEADRRTLIRRLYADLIGLPPTAEEIDAFLKDKSDDAYEKLVDRLLDSPRYGEKWARQWLDLVRFSESDGYRKDDFRPTLWRYRDYVIRSFNDDKPYDQFVQEQVAGDELAPDDPDSVTATAYWRLYLYEYNQRDVRTHWTAIMDELTDVSGEVFLGLGMGCAKCHDHKFDPILRRDYFRFQAFFSSILPRDDLPIGTREQKDAYAKQLAIWQEKTKTIRDQITTLEAPYNAKARQLAVEKFPPDIRVIAGKPPSEWSALERQLMDLVDRQIFFEYSRVKPSEEDGKKIDALKSQLAEFDSLKPTPLPVALTVTDAARTPAKTFIPGRTNDIAPGYLSLLDPEPAAVSPIKTAPNSTGRRSTLARWLANSENPLTARVAVNRIWLGHFGTGLVATASDFGRLGEKPSHPELLDWLTSYFVEQGWSFKAIHRMICQSATYRQSASHSDASAATKLDPQNRLRWRWDIRRLQAEQIRDAMLAASGELDLTASGPSVEATAPRRSIFTKIIRNDPDPLLSSFDATDGFNSTAKRSVTTTPTQALLMINGDWMLARSAAMAKRVDSLAAASTSGDADRRVVTLAWQIVYGRSPSEKELAGAVSYLNIASTAGAESPAKRERLEVTDSPAARIDENETTLWRAPFHESLPDADFTIEAVIQLDSLYPSANVRTIVSHWDGNTTSRGWNFGVTSEKSGYQPRNLILQLVGHVPAHEKPQYEVIASNLRPELGKPYYVAVTVDVEDTSETGVRFYMKDLSKPASPLQAAFVTHKAVGGFRPKLGVVIGDRDGSRRARWNGLIDNVRLSRKALAVEDLAIHSGSKANLAGVWEFNSTEKAGHDSSGSNNHIEVDGGSGTTKTGISSHALADLCHVLLNSNEFLYVD